MATPLRHLAALSALAVVTIYAFIAAFLPDGENVEEPTWRP